MLSTVHHELICRFITEVWNRNNTEALDELLDPAYYDFTYEPRNREGLERALLLMRTAFPDQQWSIEEIAAEGDTVGVCLTLRGTHTGQFRGVPSSGKPVEIGGYRFFKVRDGRITSHRGLLDLPSLLQQIGANA